MYTNADDKLICQICKGGTFIKRNGKYYFEAVEALTIEHFPKEHRGQYLALCPKCSAMYKEFIKNDKNAMAEVKNTLMSTGLLEIPIKSWCRKDKHSLC